MKKPYTPPKKILERYADVMVNYALGGGKGIKKGEVVYVYAPECAKSFYIELIRAIRKSGGHVISQYLPDNEPDYKFDRDLFLNASKEQLKFFPDKFIKGRIDQMDHSIGVIAEADLHSLEGVDPKKIMLRHQAFKPAMDWRNKKEHEGKLTWTGCLYGTPAMAKEVGLSEREYWKQIIKACLLDKQDPVAEWRKLYKQLNTYREKLNKLNIDKVHVEGPDVDLWVTIGKRRAWVVSTGQNIPSFEIFTSPDWRGTNGWIRFSQSLYRYGNVIKGIELEFKDGVVVKSKAKKNEKVLKAMIATPNADKVGEFSMTDRRFSRITKFMGHTLYDENVGGPHGNTHIALGNAYRDCFESDPSKIKEKEWKNLGYNSSSVHTDIVSTTPRTVTAYLPGGKTKVIYKNGQFTL